MLKDPDNPLDGINLKIGIRRVLPDY